MSCCYSVQRKAFYGIQILPLWRTEENSITFQNNPLSNFWYDIIWNSQIIKFHLTQYFLLSNLMFELSLSNQNQLDLDNITHMHTIGTGHNLK